MELSYFLIQPVFVALVGVPALIGLFVMYRLGHNKTVLGVFMADAWLVVTFAASALGLLNDDQRIVILRIGTFLLQWSFIVGGASFIIHHRRYKRALNVH